MARMIDADRLLRELTALSHGQVWPGWTYDGIRLLIERQPTLTQPNEPEGAGLHEKYTVLKNEDGSLVTNCFVLRPEKDPAAVAALRAYAATTDNAELADDIINWIGAEPNEPLTLEELREMDGEPVWVKQLKGLSVRDTDWAVVEFRLEPDVKHDKIRVWWPGSEDEDTPSEDDYGKTWIAYRRPKEEQ